eukprot:Gregarina_sp_Poly_1__8928@NODE_53_length_17536_cov_99_000057_g45_i0_p4_GENE_NODE_53_length_17536_cov_99_000057_g45_i0NODE_53_length_17536_cov_99_000057_g45_i0_p4_ORF_typecomplete_len727_score128_85PDEase_I/PF00233_19/7_5e66HD/PF01966_22/0_018BSP_II/PF05432_11/0_012CENPB_dimeris/PF09026_10/0_034DNA_pol_phi/PF04931_13/0_83Ribosomal_60s/PF00428_19/6_5Rtf2/PF04641_12/3_2e03Rtf2/PF04641_12/5_3e03Rtf2/PF04641_12/0_18_NODE_53_length_17536_cov_99_000057_g45_i0884911029
MLYLHVVFMSFYCLNQSLIIWALREPQRKVYPAVILTQVMQIVNGGILVGEAYLGRWQKEFAERVAYLDIRADQLRLKDLRDAQKKRKKGKGETVGENLIFTIKKAQTAVQTAAFERSSQGDPNLLELDEVLRQVIEILLETDDLFTVGAVTDAQEGEETETQFINMFQMIHKGGKMRPSRRKTGDDYIRLALDQQEFFTPDILPDFYPSEKFQEEVGNKTSLKLLEHYKKNPNLLVHTGICLLQEHAHFLNVRESCVTKYLYQINRRYYPNPYHNACHGAMVSHMAVCITKLLNIYPKISAVDQVSLILAGLVHDVGHPGRNNNYFLNSCGFLAKLYNDQSILEMYHCFLAFRYAQIGEEVNIFQNVAPDSYVLLRSNIIEFILVTDMSQHFASISKFRVRRASEKFDITRNSEDVALVLKCCIKMADLSHGLVDWPQHFEWSFRVCSEFYQQGKEEQTIGLPISPLCDSSMHHDWCKSQAGFLQFVVIPLANELAEIDESGLFSGELVTKVLFNKHKWEMLKEKNEAVPMPPHIANCTIAPMHYAECTCGLALKAKTVDELNADPMAATDVQALVDHSEGLKVMLKENKPRKAKAEDGESEAEEESEYEEEDEEDEESDDAANSTSSRRPVIPRLLSSTVARRDTLTSPRSDTENGERSSRSEVQTAELLSPRSELASPRTETELMSPRSEALSPRSENEEDLLSPHQSNTRASVFATLSDEES